MASPHFPLDEAQIVALFMECIFFGLYLVSFAACMRVMFSGVGLKSKVNKGMFIAALGLATFATLDVAFGLRHVLDAFIWYTGPGGPVEELEDISYWVNVMKSVTYVMQTLIGDLILIFRCYVVYEKRWWIVVAPLLVWTSTLITGSFVIFLYSHLRVKTNVDEKHLVPFITATLVLTLVQTVVTTSLIAFRIYSIDRQISKYRSGLHRGLQPILRTIIESGAIYTVSTFIFLVTYICSNNAQYPVSDCDVQIIGIVFNMIIIRVHQGRTAEHDLSNTFATSHSGMGTSTTLGTTPASRSRIVKSQTSTDKEGTYAMHPVPVRVNMDVAREQDAMKADEDASVSGGVHGGVGDDEAFKVGVDADAEEGLGGGRVW